MILAAKFNLSGRVNTREQTKVVHKTIRNLISEKAYLWNVKTQLSFLVVAALCIKLLAFCCWKCSKRSLTYPYTATGKCIR